MENLRLARTHYVVRSASFFGCLIVIGLHLWERDFGPLGWTLLVLQFAVYPQLVYLRAKHSARPTHAELDNLLLDSVLLGAWCGALGFPTWISYALISATMLNSAVNRGLRGIIYSLACNGAGAAVAIALVGLHYWPGTQPIITTLSFVGALAYACSVGYIVYRQNRRLAGARDEMRTS